MDSSKDRLFGTGGKCLVVAEIGINHNGDMDLAHRMIDLAAQAGADGIKLQNYRTEDFVADPNLMISYTSQGKPVTESQYDLFKRCELDRARLKELAAHSRESGMLFSSTPTGPEGIEDLVEAKADFIKNGSDYLGHLPLIREMSDSGIAVVLSTGMARIGEIDEAIETFFAGAGHDLCVLHCVSAYPTPVEDLNMRRMVRLRDAFNVPVGFSDHSAGTQAATIAAALGASMIEKHFTADHNLPGPDHWFSCEPGELAEMVQSVAGVDAMLGSGTIVPGKAEEAARKDYRLSCTASRSLEEGHVLTSADIAYRRPATGIEPKHADAIVGRRLARPLKLAEPIRYEDLK